MEYPTESLTVRDVLEGEDEDAAMALAAELHRRAGENPLRPDTVTYGEE